MRCLGSGVLILLLVTGCNRSPPPAAQGPIHVETIVRANPPFHAVVAKVDLVDPRVELVACAGGPDPDGAGPWETILRTPSDIARDHQLDLAINGGFFLHQTSTDDPTKYSAGDPANAAELVVIDGHRLTNLHGGIGIGSDAKGLVRIGLSDDLAATGSTQIISGQGLVVDQGKACIMWDDDPAPHTCVGLSQDGKTLIAMVVDGRRADWGLGVTSKQLGDEMVRQGAFTVISLDGGGSSTMVARNAQGRVQVLNRPSDGSLLPIPLSVERPVPYVLGIRVKR